MQVKEKDDENMGDDDLVDSLFSKRGEADIEFFSPKNQVRSKESKKSNLASASRVQ